MEEKKKVFLITYIVATLISLVIGGVIFLLFFFGKDRLLIDACNGAAISGIILLSCACIMAVAREGFFDFAAYGFKQFGSMIFARKANENNDYATYHFSKKELRKNKSKTFVPVAVVGALFILAFIVLRIIFAKYIPIN